MTKPKGGMKEVEGASSDGIRATTHQASFWTARGNFLISSVLSVGLAYILWVSPMRVSVEGLRAGVADLEKSLRARASQDALPEFGFIVPRCVCKPIHNELWRENYRCVRGLFPRAPIVIIDDYSDMTLVDQNFTMTDAIVVQSELPPGKGEALPYLYFHKHKPFKKAVVLNDGMFILQREPLWSALQNTTDYRFLWYFDFCHECDIEGTLHLMSALPEDVRDRVETLRQNTTKWVGCFASAAIMTWDFLDRLNTTYGLLGPVADAVQDRLERMGLERVLALAAIDFTSGARPLPDMAVFGSLRSLPALGAYNWEMYMQDKASGALVNRAAIKIFNGRRRLQRVLGDSI